MSLELNKFAASLLIGGLTVVSVGKISSALYHDGEMPQTRGFSIAISEAVAVEAPAAPIAASTAATPEAVPEAAAAPVDMAALIASADVKVGEGLTKACKACHAFEKDGKNKIGPALFGVFGRKIGTHEGFKYSADFAAKSSESWDEKNLSALLEKPKDFAKGTKMAFPGYKEPEKRAAVIKYLQSLK